MQEGEAFAAAAALDTHKALVHIFFAQRATKKVRRSAACCTCLGCAFEPLTQHPSSSCFLPESYLGIISTGVKSCLTKQQHHVYS